MMISGKKGFYLVLYMILLCSTAIETKRSYGLIRSRPKANTMNVRRRQQQAPYTPPAQTHAAAAPKPVAAAAPAAPPKASAPVGPPPPYSPHPVKNVGASNAAPPPYTPYQAAPHGAGWRQPYGGVNNGMPNNYHAMPHNPAMGQMGHSPYGHHAGGMYNNPGMGMPNYNPGMGMNTGAMGMGMMGAGMGMGGMNGGYGYGAPQKSSGLFSAKNILTGLAIYGAARGVGSMVSGAMGHGGYGGYGGYGHNTQHVYVHHVGQQPGVVTVDGSPAVIPVGGVVAVDTSAGPANIGVQPIMTPAPIANVNIPAAIAVTNAPQAENITAACTENCPENVGNEEVPSAGLEAYPTIHPSLFTYAGGSEDIFYWANSIEKNLTTTDTNRDKDKID